MISSVKAKKQYRVTIKTPVFTTGVLSLKSVAADCYWV